MAALLGLRVTWCCCDGFGFGFGEMRCDERIGEQQVGDDDDGFGGLGLGLVT